MQTHANAAEETGTKGTRPIAGGEVFVVILNWNGWADSIDCLESLTRLAHRAFRVIIIDNGSQDDSVARIEAWAKGPTSVTSEEPDFAGAARQALLVSYTRGEAETGGRDADERTLREERAILRLVLIRAGVNLGFAGGCNVGIRYALQAQAEYVWLLNNDTVVTSESLSRLVGFLVEHPDYVGCTGQLRLYDRPTIWNCGGNLGWWGGRRYFFAGQPVTATPQSGWRRISFMTGCCVLMRASAFTEIGPLSERFFFGDEDYEFSLRLKRGGHRIACCFEAVIYHKLGRSIDRAASEANVGRYYVLYLSRFINMRAYYPRPVWWLWRYASVAFILRRLRKSVHLPWRSLRLLAYRLLSDSTWLDAVTKERFEAATQVGLEAL